MIGQADKWAEVTGQLQVNPNPLFEEIKKMRENSEQAVADILAGPTPETCEAAIEYLRQSARR